MASLNIAGQTVKVPDEFLNLSPEKQNEVVLEIATSLGIKPSGGGAGGEVQKATGVAKALGTGVAIDENFRLIVEATPSGQQTDARR